MTLTKEDLQAIRMLLDPITADLAAMKSEQKSIKEDLQVVRDSQLKVEHEQYPRIQAALDGLLCREEREDSLDERITFLEGKDEDHGKRLFALEHGVKAG